MDQNFATPLAGSQYLDYQSTDMALLDTVQVVAGKTLLEMGYGYGG